MASIEDVEGIGKRFARKLRSNGVATTDTLLKRCATRSGRKAVAQASGISEKLILEWVNRADLCRIHGVGPEYSDLLEAAGVDTVPELARRKPQNLYARILEVNRKRKLVRQLPTERQVASWVDQAGALPRIVRH